MRIRLLLLIIFISCATFAQEKRDSLTEKVQREIINKFISKANGQHKIQAIDQLINSNVITIKELRTNLYLEKAKMNARFNVLNDFKKMNDSNKFIKNAFTTIEFYNVAIDSSNCSLKIKSQFERYEFLKKLVWIYSNDLNDSITRIYKKDLKELTEKGLKPEKDGFGLSLYFIKGNNISVGIEFSLFCSYTGVSSFKENCNNEVEIYKPNKLAYSYNALTIGYSKSFKSINNDLSISLFELNSPIVLIPTKFGFVCNNQFNNLTYYYRPTIGLAYGIFSISYAHNVVLFKGDKSKIDKNMLIVKVVYPITNHRYNIK